MSDSAKPIPNGPLANAWALGWVSYFTDTASAMVTLLLPLLVLNVLGESPAELGLIVAIGTVVSFGLRFVAGHLSDRTGQPKALALAGYAVSAGAKPALALAGSWAAVAGLRVADRLGKALRAAPRDVLIAAGAAGEVRRAFAIHKAMDLAGEATGLLIVAVALAVAGAAEARWIPLLLLGTAVPGAAAVLVAWLGVREIPRQRARVVKSFRWTWTPVPSDCLWLALATLVLVEPPLLIGRLGELGVPASWIAAAVFSGHLIAIAVTRAFASARLRGRETQWIAMGLCASGGLLLTPGATGLPVALVVGQATLTLLLLTVRSRLATIDDERRGATYGAFYLVMALCAAAGAVAAGALWSRFGFFWMALVFLILSLALGTRLAIGERLTYKGGPPHNAKGPP